MALTLNTKPENGGFEITVEGNFGNKLLKIKRDVLDLQIYLSEDEVRELVYMLEGR